MRPSLQNSIHSFQSWLLLKEARHNQQDETVLTFDYISSQRMMTTISREGWKRKNTTTYSACRLSGMNFRMWNGNFRNFCKIHGNSTTVEKLILHQSIERGTEILIQTLQQFDSDVCSLDAVCEHSIVISTHNSYYFSQHLLLFDMLQWKINCSLFLLLPQIRHKNSADCFLNKTSWKRNATEQKEIEKMNFLRSY